MNDYDIEQLSANVAAIADAVSSLAGSICPVGAAHGRDETGGAVASLTEAVMGVTAGLCRIASAIETLAQAVEDRP